MTRAARNGCREYIQTQVALLLGHERGAWSWSSVGIHQMRTAARRLRASLDSFQLLLDEQWSCRLRTELRWLRDQLGLVRDLDVLLTRLGSMLESRSTEPPHAVISLFEAQRRTMRQALRAALDSPRYHGLQDQLLEISSGKIGWLSSSSLKPPTTSPITRKPSVSELAQSSWRRLEKAVLRYKHSEHEVAEELLTREYPVSSSLPTQRRLELTNEALHRVRKRLRTTRYLAEALIPSLPVKQQLSALRFVKTASRWQDMLGDYQDYLVLRAHLNSLQQFSSLTPDATQQVKRLFDRLNRLDSHAHEGNLGSWESLSKKNKLRWLQDETK